MKMMKRKKHGLLHQPISIREAMNIQEARAAVDKGWNTLKKLPAWDIKKSNRKQMWCGIRQTRLPKRVLVLRTLRTRVILGTVAFVVQSPL